MHKFVLIFLFAGMTTWRSLASAEALVLDKLVTNGCVWVAKGEKPLFQYPSHCNSLPIPASILKIATASLAIETLGPEYRYTTEFWADPEGWLGIRGFGDPLLVSEAWEEIAMALAVNPSIPRRFSGIFLDTTAFTRDERIPGTKGSLNPYDAWNGALVTNFNSVNLHIAADGSVLSAEPQTPVLPLTIRLAQGLKPGEHRINFSRHPEYALPYLAGLARAFLTRQGFIFHSELVVERPVGPEDHRIFSYVNPRPLMNTIAGMLHYSNNFTSNQLLLTIGSQQFGPPATLKKAATALQQYLHEKLKIPATEARVEEGSGISRGNRMTPAAIVRVLEAFRPYLNLLPEQNQIHLKTGTLQGVYSLAGYLPNGAVFVIMLNQPENTRDAVLQALLDAGLGN